MRLLILSLFSLIIFGGGISVYAAESSPSPVSQNAPASPSGGLNVQPMSPGETVGHMKKMEGDIQKVGEGLAPSLSKYAIVAGVVMLVIGMVFTRKLVKAGGAMLGVAVLVFFLLGDMNKTSILLQKIVATLRSYF